MKKILVVDNHPLILQFMTNLLEKEGYQVLTTKDGLSALDILKTYIPEVIFVDLVMPNIGGKKLCQIIRKISDLKDVFIVILSATAAEEEIDFAEFGANACIAKGPFNKMGKHVLDILDRVNQGVSAGLTEEIVGLENIHSRVITRELLMVKKHFEIILGSMAEAVLEITPEKKIVYANPVALSLAGKPEEELLASDFIDLFHEDDHQRIKDLFVKAKDAIQVVSKDSPVRLNGSQASLSLLPLKDTGEKIVVILNDVSDEKQMEAQIMQAQKMEAVGTLAAGIAHDFNNLLMGIQGNASLIALEIDSTYPYYERLKNIEKQVQSGSQLTSQLLGYARKGKYKVKPINMNQLVKETSETFGRMKKEVRIYRSLAQELSAIEADRNQIEQVLFNLYVNAGDAMPGGGDLFLKTMNTTHEDMVDKLYDPKPGRYVLLTISDTGFGIDKKTLERIFEPFFTTKGMGRGTGLGLASVYGIIKGHGGYIDVDSKIGEGTTFTIYLPASEALISDELPAVEREEIKEGDETILLVDDEIMILDIAREILKAMGYHVLTAKNGEEAVEIYRGNKDSIELVLLDMIMPGMGGGDVYDQMKEVNPDIKALLSSGYSIDGEAMEILKRGCDGFIQKPFKMKALSEKIRKVLDG